MKFGALSGFPQLTKIQKKNDQYLKLASSPAPFTCEKGLWDEVNLEPGDINETTFILP